MVECRKLTACGKRKNAMRLHGVLFPRICFSYFIRASAGLIWLGLADIKRNRLTFVNLFLFGAGGRGRTDTVSLPLDFESSTSANSITPANVHIIAYSKRKIKSFFKKTLNIFLSVEGLPKSVHFPCSIACIFFLGVL